MTAIHKVVVDNNTEEEVNPILFEWSAMDNPDNMEYDFYYNNVVSNGININCCCVILCCPWIIPCIPIMKETAKNTIKSQKLSITSTHINFEDKQVGCCFLCPCTPINKHTVQLQDIMSITKSETQLCLNSISVEETLIVVQGCKKTNQILKTIKENIFKYRPKKNQINEFDIPHLTSSYNDNDQTSSITVDPEMHTFEINITWKKYERKFEALFYLDNLGTIYQIDDRRNISALEIWSPPVNRPRGENDRCKLRFNLPDKVTSQTFLKVLEDSRDSFITHHALCSIDIMKNK